MQGRLLATGILIQINISMGNLVAFGCSLTFGHGLPDCFIPPVFPGKSPSLLSWPALVAKNLGVNCANNSSPGSSNFEIALSVMSYKFNKDDLCLIMWSYPDRDIVIHDNGYQEKLGAWADQSKFQKWLSLNPDATRTIKFWFNVVAIDRYLKMIGLKYFNLTVGLQYIPGLMPVWASEVKFLDANINRYRHKFPKALDDRHPGELAHAAMAKDVLLEIER